MLLYRTIIGSRLYGTSGPDSDYDWMEVYDSMRYRPKQKVSGESDTVKVSLSTFMLLADQGRHQYLEAMFAPETDVDYFYDLRSRYYPNTANAVNLYRRTINKFGDHKARKKVKAMQTALRMTYNLEELLDCGRFDPRLDSDLAVMIKSMSWDEAFYATEQRMHHLAERYGI